MMKESTLGFHAVTPSDTKQLDTLHERNARLTREALEKFMRPELINRFDGIVTFRALTRAEVGKIFDLLIAELRTRLVPKALSVSVTPSAKRWLIDKGYSTKYGARPLRRVIEDEVEHRIAEGIIDNIYQKGDILEVTTHKGELVIGQRHEGDAA